MSIFALWDLPNKNSTDSRINKILKSCVLWNLPKNMKNNPPKPQKSQKSKIPETREYTESEKDLLRYCLGMDVSNSTTRYEIDLELSKLCNNYIVIKETNNYRNDEKGLEQEEQKRRIHIEFCKKQEEENIKKEQENIKKEQEKKDAIELCKNNPILNLDID